MKKNERLQALKVLVKLVQEKVPLSHLMQATSDLTPLSKEICFGVCRQYIRLEVMADCLVSKRPKSLEVWLVLLIGLYQLHFMQKPDYAVVKETVALLDLIKKNWAKGLVNAVLRRFCREQQTPPGPWESNDYFVYNHPQWLIQRLRKDWPQDWQAILQANDCHPPMSLRVNQRHMTRQAYRERLQQNGMNSHPHVYSPEGVRLETAVDVKDLPGFECGDVSVQDESAQLAVSLLELRPGLRLLDACCAPGGKLCHILEAESHLAACIGLDIDERRLQRVRENLQRLNLQAILIQGDALKPDWWDGELFDRILLDAPCSATGVIRRHPDIKLLRTEADIQAIVNLQYKLLQKLWPLLAPGGVFVYATCSIMREENEQQIMRFIAHQTDCQFAADDKPWGKSTGHGWQILPKENEGDGFFYTVLRKQ
ncbi:MULTISPECIES: 16S rRNA (cytosine(967)-C(5))-methyltransferase RsmB [unclassified Legionella]|uniref:16S rRNA (cytosine(967)-C(5))-methyltransferase RsmB n=1 Tax=unclassified Legionella TaxID=2622702 RepID=UPI0010549943|nr:MULTISPECIES: 16S rRNA (cytosine(967)-C(5))-methyltransferase RsmB [unclassified Legionella]MDI9818501.1 16S rRNA (cytosine(967)-C(5))-methyltransferase RsmB [Legionella sp. PL877]